MAHLHEILAVEDGLKKTAEKLIAETNQTFKKENLFNGETRTLEMFSDEPDKKAEEGTTVRKLETTVDENLDYTTEALANYWDAVLAKEASNQHAKADLIVEGVVLARDLPATFLLGMEARLGAFRKTLEAIPTLAPGIRWERDETAVKGVYRTKDDAVSFKTEKHAEFRSVAAATREHPEQVVQVNVTRNVGRYVTVRQSGMLTPLDKAMRLGRIDKLIRAVKKARMRANDAEVKNVKVANVMVDYIMAGSYPQ